MTRLLILALFPALCFGQTKFQAELDAEHAAQWQRRIEALEVQQNKGLVSRETAVKEKAEAAQIVNNLRKSYAGTPLAEIFEKEFQVRLRMARGETSPAARDRALKSLWGAVKLIPQAVIGLLPWIIGLALLGAIATGIIKWMEYRPADPTPPATTVHGSASWAEQIFAYPKMHWMGGVFFGKSSTPELKDTPLEQDKGAPVYSYPENHTLIVARTRTGKGTRVIIPTLAKYFGSMLVIDPKGENAAITARERARWQHNDVHILNPWGELAGTFQKLGFTPAKYNPLDILERDDPNAVAIAQALAGAICPRDAKGKDSYWSDSAASVLTAVLLWLTEREGVDEVKTLARAREIVTKSRSELKEKFLVKMAASEEFGGAIRENSASFIDLAPETYSGVMSNLAQHTKFLSDPQIKAATSSSSFAMEDLVRTPATVYLVIPPDRMETQRTWLRLIITAGMHTFKRATARGEHRCMFLIDEFPALGRLDDLPRDIATMAGYGVDFTLVVQGIDQLKDVYGDAHAAILSNCAFKWFCNISDLHSAEYLSKTLGKATVGTTSKNVGEKQSVTYSETGRELLTPDEILTIGRDVAILLQPGTKPVYLRPVDYWKLGEAFAMYRPLEPQMFWEPPIGFDPNPYHAASAQGSATQAKA